MWSQRRGWGLKSGEQASWTVALAGMIGAQARRSGPASPQSGFLAGPGGGRGSLGAQHLCQSLAGVWAEGLDREWTPGLERKFKWFVGLPPQHLTMDFFVPLLVSGHGARVLGAGGVRYPTGVLSG